MVKILIKKGKITIKTKDEIGVINPNIYGHFIEHVGQCIYPGIWVGTDSNIPNMDGIRTDVIEALKPIHPPVIRWPGGCFADTYHWKDGIGPRNLRPRRPNLWWGGVENNEFGTDEFLKLCTDGHLLSIPLTIDNNYYLVKAKGKLNDQEASLSSLLYVTKTNNQIKVKIIWQEMNSD